MKKRLNRIGILTGGGDCPGLNAVIRGVAKAAMLKANAEIVGILDGFEGLIQERTIPLNWQSVSGILTQGGTILGTTNRADPFNWIKKNSHGKIQHSDISETVISTIEKLGLHTLVCIGGDGTMAIAHKLSRIGVRVVGVPKTIDNDIFGTDLTFGFNSAVTTAAEAIDKIHSTAMSHHRVMVVEVMGRYAGWLALESGLASGGDVILIPEIPYNMDSICQVITKRSQIGHRFSIIVVAEGAHSKHGKMQIKQIIKDSPDPVRLGGIGQHIADTIENKTDLESRVTVLGHLQRGGIPTPFDRILATRFGVKAAEYCIDGAGGVMVALKGNDIIAVPISEVGGKTRLVDSSNHLVQTARELGTCMGD